MEARVSTVENFSASDRHLRFLRSTDIPRFPELLSSALSFKPHCRERRSKTPRRADRRGRRRSPHAVWSARPPQPLRAAGGNSAARAGPI